MDSKFSLPESIGFTSRIDRFQRCKLRSGMQNCPPRKKATFVHAESERIQKEEVDIQRAESTKKDENTTSMDPKRHKCDEIQVKSLLKQACRLLIIRKPFPRGDSKNVRLVVKPE
jgi:hypothetical protein